MMGVRKLLDRVFDKNELKILDDILPEFKRHEKLDDEEALELGVSYRFNLHNPGLSYIRIFGLPPPF